MKNIVLDACVAAKTFIDEPDSQDAINLIKACVQNNISITAPNIFSYEIAQIAVKKSISLEQVLTLFETALFKLTDLQIPNKSIWLQAEYICRCGHKKSGFPTMYDSIYHAMAIINDGVLITSDKRHYEKTRSFGHIALLKQWESTLHRM